MNSDERMAILKMLAEGKISVDEAEKLLQAVGKETAGEERGARRRRAQPRELGELMEEIGEEVRKAVKSVQASEIGRVVSQEVNRAVGSLQRMDVGRMVGDIVSQVKDAVSEVVEGAGGHSVVEEMEWTLDGTGLARVEAETTNGQIRLSGHEQDQVEVRAYKKVKARSEEEARAFLGEVSVRAVREGEVVRVFKEHPKPPSGVGVEVGYEIECPWRVDAGLRLVNGNAECAGIEGAVQIQSTNGNVRVTDCRGRVEARTRNGNAAAALDELRQEGVLTTTNGNVKVELRSGRAPLTATSTNGNIEVGLPEGFDGRVDAKTTNGRARSDIELTRVEQAKPSLLIGQLGSGGEAEIRMHTLNGNVYLRKMEEER